MVYRYLIYSLYQAFEICFDVNFFKTLFCAFCPIFFRLTLLSNKSIKPSAKDFVVWSFINIPVWLLIMASLTPGMSNAIAGIAQDAASIITLPNPSLELGCNKISDDFIIIGCNKGSLKIKTLQAPSKKAVSSSDYIRGQRLKVTDILN